MQVKFPRKKNQKRRFVCQLFSVDAFVSEGEKARVGRVNTISLEASAHPVRSLNGGTALPCYPQLRLGDLFHYL